MTPRRLGELSAADLQLSNDSELRAYRANLRDHYPTMPDEAVVEIVTFRITAGNI